MKRIIKLKAGNLKKIWRFGFCEGSGREIAGFRQQLRRRPSRRRPSEFDTGKENF